MIPKKYPKMSQDILGCLQNSVCSGGNLDIHSSYCQDLIYNSCTGEDDLQGLDPTLWTTRWWDTKAMGGTTCSQAISKHLRSFAAFNQCYTTTERRDGICRPLTDVNEINSEMWLWAQSVVEKAVSNYKKLGYNIGAAPGEPGYTPFNDVMLKSVCCQNPGLCQNFLRSYCRSLPMQTVAKSSTLTRLCGCHMNPLNYEDYSASYNIQQQCSSLCNTSQSIPLTGAAGELLDCQQNVCIIDNTTITLFNNTVGGTIDFEQVCGSSDPGTVSCTVTDDVIEVLNTEIGGDLIPILNQCGTITCNKGGTASLCSVDELTSFDIIKKRVINKSVRRGGVITLLISAIILIIAGIVLYVYKKYDILREKGKGYNNR